MRRRQYIAQDDQPQYVLKRDLSGGQNTRQHPQMIEDNQGVLLQNILLETAGQTAIRQGQTLVDANFPFKVGSDYYMTDEDGNLITDEDGNYFPIPT